MAGGWANGATGVSVALSPDGKRVAAAGQDNILRLWDVATGKEVRQIPAPSTPVGTVVFAPDARTLAGRAGDQTIHLWDVATGKELRQIKGQPFGPAGFVAVANVFSLSGLAYSPDGKLLAGAEIAIENQQQATSITLWEADTGKVVRRIPAPPPYGASSLAFTPDGKALAFGSGNTIHLVDPATGKGLRKMQGPPSGVATLALSPDGKLAAAKGFNDARAHLYDLETGKFLRHLGGEALPTANAFQAAVWTMGGTTGRELAFSPDSKVLAVAGGPLVRLWEAATAKEVTPDNGHRAAVTALVVAPGGKLVGSYGADSTVRLWQASTGRERHQFRVPQGTTCAAFAPDGRAVALGNTDGTVRLHEAATGRELRRFQGHKNGVASVAFGPDGKTLASRSAFDHTVRLYDLSSGRELRQIHLQPPGAVAAPGQRVMVWGGSPEAWTGLAFSADGKILAVLVPASVNAGAAPGQAGSVLRLWDVATGKEVRRVGLPAQPGVASFALAPDGRAVATENNNGTVTVWEVASGKERARLGSPRVPPAPQAMAGLGVTVVTYAVGPTTTAIAFGPDGRTVIAPGPGWSLQAWDVVTGKERGRLKGHEGEVTALALTPDGKRLASGSGDTTSLVWDLNRLKPATVRQPVQLAPGEADALWADLSGEDAVRAFRSMQRLAAAPGQAVTFLRARLRPAARVDPARLERLIADLGSGKFRTRQHAASELEKLGELAVPALGGSLGGKQSLETRRRVEQLLEKLTRLTLSPEQLRLVRAVEVLEQAGTDEAQQVLAALAGGAPGALPTREAQAAFDRLAR
jgi:WD40 repeat protein